MIFLSFIFLKKIHLFSLTNDRQIKKIVLPKMVLLYLKFEFPSPLNKYYKKNLEEIRAFAEITKTARNAVGREYLLENGIHVPSGSIFEINSSLILVFLLIFTKFIIIYLCFGLFESRLKIRTLG